MICQAPKSHISLAPRILSRSKGYVAPGGRSAVPRRVPRKLKTGEVRPAIYYKFDQTVELSDGSTVSRRTVFPRTEWKYLADQRNTPLWNPSLPDLRALELDASGKLAKFRKRFQGLDDGAGHEKMPDTADAFDLDDLMSDGAEVLTSGRLHQAKVAKKKK